MQACKFADGEESEKASNILPSSGNGLQDRIGKSLPFSAIGGNLAHQTQPQTQNANSVLQFAPSISNQQPGPHQGQWLPATSFAQEQPIELLQNCVLEGWCPHDPKKLQYCDLNGQQFLQCSPSGWVMKACPYGTHFVGPIGRCVDPREAGAGGSVLPPPASPSTTANPSNIPFAPPGSQLSSSQPSAVPPAPSSGSWIGNNIPIGSPQQPIVQAQPPQSASGFQSPLHTPVFSSFPSQAHPRPAFQPQSQTAPFFSQSGSGQSANANSVSDTALQKAHELPQGQLVIIGTNPHQPASNNQFPASFPSPQQPFANTGHSQEVPPNWPPPPPSSNVGTGAVVAQVAAGQFPILHPRNKIFPQVPFPPAPASASNWPPSGESGSSEIGLAGGANSNLELPPSSRWNPNPIDASQTTPALAGPLANFQQPEVNQNQLPSRFQPQNWVLGGNVNNFSPTTDIRELPMGTWVSTSPQQPQQQQQISWAPQPAPLNSFQATDTVISRRYSIGTDSEHSDQPSQNSQQDEEKKL